MNWFAMPHHGGQPEATARLVAELARRSELPADSSIEEHLHAILGEKASFDGHKTSPSVKVAGPPPRWIRIAPTFPGWFLFHALDGGEPTLREIARACSFGFVRAR
jgi:hypothetical protein